MKIYSLQPYNESAVISTCVRLDKMVSIIRFPKDGANKFPPPEGAAGKNLNAINDYVCNCTSAYEKGAKSNKSKKYPFTRASYPLSTKTKLWIVYGYNAPSQRMYATFQFNPSFLTQDATLQLITQFAQMFSDGYAEFFNTAFVSHVEVALDVHGGKKSDYIFVARNVRTYDACYEPHTTYLGSETSKLQFTIYDKQRQLAETAGIHVEEPWLRIEATLRDGKQRLSDLPSIQSALSSLAIVEVAKLASGSKSTALGNFRQEVEDGVHPQAAFGCSEEKAELFDELSALAPEWLKGDVWERFSTAASILHPTVMQGIAESPHSPTSELESLGYLNPIALGI